MVVRNVDATVAVAGGSSVERIVCHRRLPLIAGLDAARPAVHIWEFGRAGLREVAVVDADADAYPPEAWQRIDLVPSVAWHPREPVLMVAGEAGIRRWAPDGICAVAGLPADAEYRDIAFSPDGRTLWAWPPSSSYENTVPLASDALAPGADVLFADGQWDTGIVEHPGGGLVVTLASDQGATHMLFARPDDGVPARIRVLRHAVILDVDGYQAPVISADGRFIAIRGNAYVESLDVFEFPTLRKVLHTTLGDPYPSAPYPPEWLAEQDQWSSHNIAFTRHAGSLLVGTAQGNIIEIDLDGGQTFEHGGPGTPVSALAVTSTGHLVVADRAGQLAVMDVAGDNPLGDGGPAGGKSARDRAEEFLAATTELPDDADLDASLIVTDGDRWWDADDLGSVVTSEDDDPIWLRKRAVLNVVFDARE